MLYGWLHAQALGDGVTLAAASRIVTELATSGAQMLRLLASPRAKWAVCGSALAILSASPALADPADAEWATLLGAGTVVLSLLLLVTSLAASAIAFALRVVCRVFGNWAAATGILSIGWIIAAHRQAP